MFLKRFEAKGFKSFADYTAIDFNHNMTGIVGPNGAGKSNIVDGLKWVLGQQSRKELRVDDNTDFIFSGSESKGEAQYAEVSLTFDNTTQKLKSDLSEITITRKLTRGISKNEYFINGEDATLSKVKEIFIDTGLSKGSLGIIAQDSVSEFIRAKEIDRRKIFEDAAGLGKFIASKKEALNKLEKTQIQLNDVQIRLNETEKIINRLTKQAEKAQEYLAKKEQLKKVHVTLLAKDIISYQIDFKKTNDELKEKQSFQENQEPEILILNEQLKNLRQQSNEADDDISKTSGIIIELTEKLSNLQNQKNQLESQLEVNLHSENIDEQIKSYESLIQIAEKINTENQKKYELISNEILTFEDIKNDLFNKHQLLLNEIRKFENIAIEKNTNLNQINRNIEQKYQNENGIKTILANKNYLHGVIDVLENLISIPEDYEIAITKALGRNLKNIIVHNNSDVKNAIEFLKKNRAGTATFIPLNDIIVKNFPEDHLNRLQNLEGFIGLANDLVKIDPEYQKAIDFSLNKTIIADDFDNASRLSKFTNKVYRVISLDGVIIAPFGAVTGGYENRNKYVSVNLESKRDFLKAEITDINNKIHNLKVEANIIHTSYAQNLENLNQKKQYQATLKSKIDDNLKKLNDLTFQFEKISRKKTFNLKEEKNIIDHLIVEIVQLQDKLEKEKQKNSLASNFKKSLQLDINKFDSQLHLLSSNISSIKDEIHQLELKAQRINSLLKSNTDLLVSEYEITLDHALELYSEPLNMADDVARSLVFQLKNDIKNLGNLNLTAAEELQKTQEDYATKKIEFEKINDACNHLNQIILELNKKAEIAFSEVINKVNENLPSIFEYLFGGGICKVAYTDPENILESGIEINVQLPGKTITNLKQFSGGEKTLIALAILFSVLRTSTLPLIILDEAEAALDIANVERFAKMIRRNCQNTQFITITHRSGTMGLCDILYGVTMQAKGISMILNIDLKDANRYVINNTIEE